MNLPVPNFVSVPSSETTMTMRHESIDNNILVYFAKGETGMSLIYQHHTHATGLSPLGCQMYNHGRTSDNKRPSLKIRVI